MKHPRAAKPLEACGEVASASCSHSVRLWNLESIYVEMYNLATYDTNHYVVF